MTDNTLDVFLHIPKTAGTSFNTLLTRVYGAQSAINVPATDFDVGAQCFTSLPEPTQEATRLVRGHILHGLHRYVNRPVRYFTILRDPQSRIRSFLDHAASEAALAPDNDSPWFAAIRDWSDFETFAARRPWQVDNYMVRALSGVNFAPGTCSKEILKAAILNLDAMPAFGLQNHLSESVLLLKRAMGWRVLPVLSKAKSGNPNRIALSDRDRTAIDALNGYDMALWDYACARFEQRMNRALRLEAGFYRELTPLVTQTEKIVRQTKLYRSAQL